MATPKIRNRSVPGDKSRDPSSIELNTYNEKAGSRKSSEVGRKLLPMGNGAGGFTTDASTKRILDSAGLNIAVYNNSAAVHAVTVGDSTVTAQAAGAVQAGTNFAGMPCPPNAWSYFALGEWNNVVTDSATLMVFVIDDDSSIVVQPANNAST